MTTIHVASRSVPIGSRGSNEVEAVFGDGVVDAKYFRTSSPAGNMTGATR